MNNHILFMDDLKFNVNNDNEIDNLVKVVKFVFGDNEMQFEFDKYAVLKMKRRKQVHCEGIDLGDGVGIEQGDEEENKEIPEILEMNHICHEKMKEK